MHPSVTEFLERVWTSRTINHRMSMEELDKAVYAVHTPQAPYGVRDNWNQVNYHGGAKTPKAWRVYISATPPSLKKVWLALENLFKEQLGVVAAKHDSRGGGVSG